MNEHVLSFKNLINSLRDHASGHFVTYKQLPLSTLMKDAEVHKMFMHPKKGMNIIEWLESEGYIQKHNRSYKWVDGEIKQDSEVIAQRAYDDLSRELPKKRPYTKRKKAEDVHEIEKQEHFSREQKITSKCYTLNEKGYFLYNNVISSGNVIGIEYEMAEDTNFSGLVRLINYSKIICKILMDNENVISLYMNDFFPSPELLLKALEVRFKNKK